MYYVHNTFPVRNMNGAKVFEGSRYRFITVRVHFCFCYGMIYIDITVRDRKLKFPLNQNVLRDVTSRWSMRITARSSDY